MPETVNVAKVLMQDENENFLVVQEAESQQWELPGGKIEEYEDRFETARREAEEEVNLEISSLTGVVRVEVEDEKCVNCWIIYAGCFSGKIELEDKLSDFRWVSAEEFYELDWKTDAGYNIPAMTRLKEYFDQKSVE